MIKSSCGYIYFKVTNLKIQKKKTQNWKTLGSSISPEALYDMNVPKIY